MPMVLRTFRWLPFGRQLRRPRATDAAAAYDGLRSETEIRRELVRQIDGCIAVDPGRAGMRRRTRMAASLARIAVAFADARDDWKEADAAAVAAGTPHRDDVASRYRAIRARRCGGSRSSTAAAAGPSSVALSRRAP